VVKQLCGTVTLDQSRGTNGTSPCDEEHSPATAAKAKVGATSIYPTKDTKASIAATKVSYSKVSERKQDEDPDARSL
ncbi:hypothetical protein Cadr_000020295, partial [Camelus dromedarius]